MHTIAEGLKPICTHVYHQPQC